MVAGLGRDALEDENDDAAKRHGDGDHRQRQFGIEQHGVDLLDQQRAGDGGGHEGDEHGGRELLRVLALRQVMRTSVNLRQ